MKNSHLLIIIGEEKMPEKEECSYDELNENVKIKAMENVDYMVRVKIGLATGARMLNKPLIECIITSLETVFDNDGKIIYNSKKYKVTTNELIKKVHDQCSKGK